MIEIKRYSSCRTTLLLIGVNTAVWVILSVVYLLSSHTSAQPESSLSSAELNLALSSSLPVLAAHPWSILTYMFTQSSFLHLLFNMLWLLWFGAISEPIAGGRRVVGTYLTGGLAGGILYLLWGLTLSGVDSGGILLGSSASVLAVMTATAIRNPNMEVNLLLAGPIRLKWIALLCILLAFIGACGGSAGSVWAHLGGILAGALSGRYEKGALRHTLFKLNLWRNRRRAKALHTVLNPGVDSIPPQERLDQLLDKIRISGYPSLTHAERLELTKLSKELNR